MHRLQKNAKKAQAKSEYFEKELKQQTEKYKKLQEKVATLLKDTENICASYERFAQIAGKLV